MTSKEALKNICIDCEKSMAKSYVRCPFRSISNEYCDEYMKIEKDLEVLEILKKHIYIMSSTKDLSGEVLVETIGLWLHSVDKDYTKVKEWLENEI